MRKKNVEEQEIPLEISLPQVKKGRLIAYILGTEPMIVNRMAEKAKQQLLQPPPKKNQADKSSSPKHMVLEEFRAAAHMLQTGPTLLALPSMCFKGALRNAALDLPGTKKAVIGRLTYVEGEMVSIYGIPQLLMSVVRNSDINRTPDIRSRPILPKWAAKLSISYVVPLIQDKVIMGLLQAGGIYIGVGDFRSEKGLANYGQFKPVSANDPELLEILKTGGRKAQEAAMLSPTFYNAETEELYHWYNKEMVRRGFTKTLQMGTQEASTTKPNGQEVEESSESQLA